MSNVFTNITDYLRSSREEFSKVSWPSRQDTVRYSALVIAISIVVAAFFAGLDFLLSHGVQTILAKHLPASASSVQTAPQPTQNQIQLTPTIESTTGSSGTLKVTPATGGSAKTVTPPLPVPSNPANSL